MESDQQRQCRDAQMWYSVWFPLFGGDIERNGTRRELGGEAFFWLQVAGLYDRRKNSGYDPLTRSRSPARVSLASSAPAGNSITANARQAAAIRHGRTADRTLTTRPSLD